MDRRIPTKQHLEWQEKEIGVLIHYDIKVFEPDFNYWNNTGYVPSAEKFNPTQLDTDQWVKTAVDLGAKYAVLVVKHCTGFALWPTKAYPYSVAASPWREGKGDILRDFITSCKKYNVLPGLYCSTIHNTYMKVVARDGRVHSGDPAAQEEYNRAVETMADEIWGEYGEMFELWFDGGTLPAESGGPRLGERLIKYQPNAVCFGGPMQFPSLLRWSGNEEGIAPEPCWGWSNITEFDDGLRSTLDNDGGHLDGVIWAPVEADMPVRSLSSWEGGWFWKAGEDHYIYSLNHLMERYEKTVGRNANLMIGITVDDRGLVPDAEAARLKEFGDAIKAAWGNPMAECGPADKNAIEIILPIPEKVIDRAIIMEDITNGQAIRKWTLEALGSKGEKTVLAEGESLGHKRLLRFDPVAVKELIFTVNEYDGDLTILKLAAFEV